MSSEMIDRLKAVIKTELGSTPWPVIERIAVKVIKEMREPTQGMIDETSLLTTTYHGRAAVYAAMIDAALKDHSPHG